MSETPIRAVKKDIDLRGKDYFTREEAAHYACCSERQFDEMRKVWNFPEGRWAGKVVFRRDDIQRAIEAAWQQSEKGAKRGTFAGAAPTAIRRERSATTPSR